MFLSSLVFILLLPLVPTSSGGYVTYYSGDDVVLSTGGSGVSAARNLQHVVYGNLAEEFNTPPFSTADIWCEHNGWSCSGSCPCWPRTLSLTVTSDGKLEWHNWFHTIGGAIYDFRMWKEIDPVGSEFELYMPITVGRASWGSGIGGSPPLHIYVTLYDVAGVQLFSADTVQDFCIRSITASFYGSATTSSVSLAGVSCKLWQNSSGAYFSYDNGTSVMASGRFYTDPARVEIRFCIWEHNDIQPYSDYEYWIDIDRVVLRPTTTDAINFGGLPAGGWYLISNDGKVITNNTLSHGGTLSYNQTPFMDEFSDGSTTRWTNINLATMSESGGYLSTYSQEKTWGQGAGAYYVLPSPQSGNFYVETSLTYTGQTGDLAELYLAVKNPSGSIIAYAGVCDAWGAANPQFAYGVTDGSSWGSGANTMPASGYIILRLERSGSTWMVTASGAYSGQWLITGTTDAVAGVFLIHTRYFASASKLAQWDYVYSNLPGWTSPINGALVGLCDYTYIKRSTFYANTTATYHDDGNYFTLSQTPGQTALTIQGVPANDVSKVYQGDLLKKTIISNGSTIVVTQAEIPQPFDGSLMVMSRPYLHPATAYNGTLNWNDQLTYSSGTLMKSSTGAQLQQASTGSECDLTSGWAFSYNLYTGGLAPTFSSSGGYIRFDESALGDQGDPPYMEAVYYMEYPLNVQGMNFTVSVSSDGCFRYRWWSPGLGDWMYTGYGQITVYFVQGTTWTQIAQSAQSFTPSLTTTVANISPSNVTSVDKVVVQFYTYGRGRLGRALYMDGAQWGRVDHLRINYSKIPNGYPGVPVTGLQPGWRAVFGSDTYWVNSSGGLTIPVGASTWPSNQGVTVYPPSESYTANFTPGTVYYPLMNKTYTPETDTIYYEVSSEGYSYRVELRLLSVITVPGKSGATQLLNFKYLVYDNGVLRDKGAPIIYVNGLRAAVTKISDIYSTSFSTLGNVQYVNFSSIDGTGIRLACKLKVTK